MTGFGTGEAALGGGRIAVEVRSVNHRYLEVRVRTPRELGDLGAFLEHAARERLGRGRIDVSVRLEGAALPPPTLDTDRAREALAALGRLRDEALPGAEVPLALLGAVPDLFVSQVDRHIDAIRAASVSALEAATAAMDAMRRREGAALAADLRARAGAVRALVRAIGERAPAAVEAQRGRLKERVDKLLSARDAVDAGRIEAEVAILADRCDVAEEIVRMGSHLGQVEEALGARDDVAGEVGKRLDFLLQELGREINTVGHKSQDAAISRAVVEVKVELERMRQQVQNVE